MAHALSIGARGLGAVWPNPAVGCVIVNDGRIVGRGWTQAGGAPHGEVVALAQAGAAAKGATAYVTLEPCSHTGRTPPCADALITAGIARVVVAVGDPNPQVDGAGIARLRDAGIKVTTGILEDQARVTHTGFFTRITESRPMITLKLAASLDGRIATANGESKWITGPDARRAVHVMRAAHDAVMVGGGTARADNPSLNVRDIGVTHQPTRIVWSRALDLPLQSVLARTAGDVALWILHAEDADPHLISAWKGIGARLFAIPYGADRQLNPLAAMQALAGAGLTRIFCEGGGQLAASLLAAGLVDELVGFTAGLALGAEGQPMLGAMGLKSLSNARRFELVETRNIGGDVLMIWRSVRDFSTKNRG
ncbi:MAG: bifunctional diaminohydroxyphosphoribosylaminopyrimidine deaminase/5-amino-6-(5-phosphoribosylamino)uracil reductase RibD [Marinosulfonomonas sp.]|nr:bifunctional diaminohydroxyphosphoribosylaminopyrimidine deaminase/5-amino-6-(5-phosphoribosylamino)uracil reductase RibD [Marinosulfonomonas sp.]